jgi:hypothetical protein
VVGGPEASDKIDAFGQSLYDYATDPDQDSLTGSYNQRLATARNQTEEEGERSPFLTQMAPGMVLGAVGGFSGGAAGAAQGLGKSTAVGGAFGAAGGVANTQDAGLNWETAKNAVMGALYGAATGAAIHGVSAGGNALAARAGPNSALARSRSINPFASRAAGAEGAAGGNYSRQQKVDVAKAVGQEVPVVKTGMKVMGNVKKALDLPPQPWMEKPLPSAADGTQAQPSGLDLASDKVAPGPEAYASYTPPEQGNIAPPPADFFPGMREEPPHAVDLSRAIPLEHPGPFWGLDEGTTTPHQPVSMDVRSPDGPAPARDYEAPLFNNSGAQKGRQNIVGYGDDHGHTLTGFPKGPVEVPESPGNFSVESLAGTQGPQEPLAQGPSADLGQFQPQPSGLTTGQESLGRVAKPFKAATVARPKGTAQGPQTPLPEVPEQPSVPRPTSVDLPELPPGPMEVQHTNPNPKLESTPGLRPNPKTDRGDPRESEGGPAPRDPVSGAPAKPKEAAPPKAQKAEAARSAAKGDFESHMKAARGDAVRVMKPKMAEGMKDAPEYDDPTGLQVGELVKAGKTRSEIQQETGLKVKELGKYFSRLFHSGKITLEQRKAVQPGWENEP